MLPNVGCAIYHSNLRRDFNIQSPPPKSLYEHSGVFQEIVNSEVVNSDWRCCVMYFSENWIEKIRSDKGWVDLKQYLYELAWHQFEFEISRVHYDGIFSMIQQERNLKPNPYLTDTAKHLFSTAIGIAPGYVPAVDDEALPVSLIQKAFVESYGLKKYLPTVMQPAHFVFEQDSFPIYYSLQNPSTHVFSPKSRLVSSTLFEMRELVHIMKIFTAELSRKNSMCFDTVIGEAARELNFNFFHNKVDKHGMIKDSSDIVNFDKRFAGCPKEYRKKGAVFASDAPFLRGCISINKKSN